MANINDASADENLSPAPVGDQTAVAAILRARAKLLARIPAREDAGAALEVIAFQLAGATYALESAYIREVLSLRDVTPMPGTPPFVVGVINVRGQIQTVIDLKQFLDLPTRALNEEQQVILLRASGMEVGVLADSVEGARRVAQAAIQTSLPALLGVTGQYVRGVTDEALIVLDAAKVLCDERLLVNDAA
jgi:purine-binding chemotaxis protein CheW